MSASTVYAEGQSARSREVAALDRRARGFATARLAVAVAALGLLGGIAWGHLGLPGAAALGACAVGFAALVFVHGRILDARERSAAGLRFHERGLARLAHDWDRLPLTSERFRRAEHPFAIDLDVFGHGSLMQLVDASETAEGEAELARLLTATDPGAWPGDVASRQEAVRDLARRTAFRESLAVAGGMLTDEKPDASALLRWAEGRDQVPAPLRVVGLVVPASLVGAFGATRVLGWPPAAEGLLALLALGVGGVIGTRLASLLNVASTQGQAIGRWRAMIEAVEGEPFEAPRLRTLRDRFVAEGRAVSAEIAALERLVGFADARRNEVFRFLIGPLLMWDVHWAVALVRWRDWSGPRVRGWLEALAQLEALASLGGFAFEHPDFAWPALTSEPGLDAQGLGHPLLPEARRVGNDVVLPSAGHALVVTGSNMSGKSTLLRALGVSVVLANAGAPVCARRATLGPCRVATSMRIADSLEQGVSHFYAELRRLKEVLDLARDPGQPPVMFLLDEILHGTNSRERIVGACAVVRDLVARGALGAVSTHDLGITVLAGELPGRVENVHFEEQVHGEAMTFDYVLRPGVVKSSNALRLMRAVGIDVPELPDAPAES